MNGKAILVLLVMAAICQCVVIADTPTKAAPPHQTATATAKTAPAAHKQNIAAHAAAIVKKLGQVNAKLAAGTPPTGQSTNNVMLINHSSSKMCIKMK